MSTTLASSGELPKVSPPPGGQQTRYELLDGAIAKLNGEFFFNRPVYANHMDAFLLAGDRPLMRMVCDPYTYGYLLVGVAREEQAKWVHQFDQVLMRYAEGRIQWRLSDPAFPGLGLTLEAVTLADAPGFAARLSVEGAQNGDKLIWAFGGATGRTDGGSLSWSLDPMHPDGERLVRRQFVPEDCHDNRIQIDGDLFLIRPPVQSPSGVAQPIVVTGRCSAEGKMSIADAKAWQKPLALAESQPTSLPLVCSSTPLNEETEKIYWIVEGVRGDRPVSRSRLGSPAQAFVAGKERLAQIARQVTIHTPEPRLDAAVSAACVAMDATLRPPVYVHGTMLWSVPFPGWRILYGPTAFGWHANVLTEAAYYIKSQVTESGKTAPHSDPQKGYSQEAADSRFYGRGRIVQDGGMYNFQSLFFDALIYAWRATADPTLEKLLRPALELQLEWSRECFDPDGDGAYESYINTWPTDSQWYGGGASAEETAFAYRGHQAAAEMARRAGDTETAKAHEERSEKIRRALMSQLWIPEKGYVGAYREQLPPHRLHEDSWLYSIFLPIDAGMLEPLEAAQALDYTRWGLERIAMPFGGERCWTSNWVPSVWSVRELYPGDNYHLALAYYQTGLAREGWELLKGNFLLSCFNERMPGSFCASGCGGDFTDVICMFCQAVAEGLFGYRPDYPNGRVLFAPQFPTDWPTASIRTPDFSLAFERVAGIDRYELTLTQPAKILLRVPSPAKKVREVRVDGQRTGWRMDPGFERSIVNVDLPSCTGAKVEIEWSDAVEQPQPVAVAATTGQPVRLEAPQGPITQFADPQGVVANPSLENRIVIGKASANAGHHLAFGLVNSSGAPQWQRFEITVSDPESEEREAAKHVDSIPADVRWDCVDMTAALNGDIRTIFQQQYLSPRPQTCSVRLGSDGYSPWTFYYWGDKPPAIGLDRVPQLLGERSQLLTPQGAPFRWLGEGRNIAFASQWDNWPRSVTVPIGRPAEAAWFLVCGSTNPMQTRIANGVLRMRYADGETEEFPLIPPINYWALCPLKGVDYDYKRDGFCLPQTPPPTVQLGSNCRAIVLSRRLRPGVALESVTLETLSQEVVIGLMGVTLMNSK